jgi:hypothetical protein
VTRSIANLALLAARVLGVTIPRPPLVTSNEVVD